MRWKDPAYRGYNPIYNWFPGVFSGHQHVFFLIAEFGVPKKRETEIAGVGGFLGG